MFHIVLFPTAKNEQKKGRQKNVCFLLITLYSHLQGKELWKNLMPQQKPTKSWESSTLVIKKKDSSRLRSSTYTNMTIIHTKYVYTHTHPPPPEKKVTFKRDTRHIHQIPHQCKKQKWTSKKWRGKKQIRQSASSSNLFVSFLNVWKLSPGFRYIHKLLTPM